MTGIIFYFKRIEEKSLMKKHQDMLKEIILNILKHQQKLEKMLIKYLSQWLEKS